MANAFVTGAGGFIGSVLCEKLLSEGYAVIGAQRSLQSSNLPHGVKRVKFDLNGENIKWNSFLSGVDTVIHLAARVHVMKNNTVDPLTAYRKINVYGTENLARQAAELGVKRFVFLSTVKVNGEKSWIPYTETALPAPVDSYGISKMEAEVKLRKIAAETGMAVVILRPPLVYGPGVKANFLKLIQAVDRRMPLPFAGVKNQRSLIYVGNLVDAIVSCVLHPNAPGQTFLVSDGKDVSTPELIRMVAAALQKQPRLFRFPALALYMAGRLTGRGPALDRLIGSLTVDTGKIKNELGWTAPFTLEEGLRNTAFWYKRIKKSK